MREREVEMMMKGLVMKQQQQPLMEENLSNLTCASGETSVSSGHRAENHSVYPHQHFLSPSNQPPPAKKKRNLPGNPDPDAQVIALSPRSLLATNRFVCEICNKGFQRDQNLQLHRRGHNLPWKLKQRNNKEVKKKVYVCPEAGCIHHDPSRALGDLTGIKKHFCRKHGEKKWKCEKCSKRYAVQSDWKAHSKICGTREYRCECGTIFSRRDSFITHRAFCDVLAQANEGSVGQTNNTPMIFMKKEEIQNFGARADEITAPWLGFSSNKIEENPSHSNNNRMGLGVGTGLINPYYHETNSDAHTSATALLQRAAQMGASMSNNYLIGTHQGHVSAVNNITALDTTNGFGLNLSAREVMNSGLFVHKAVDDEGAGGPPPHPHPPASSFLQEMMNSISSTGNYYNNGFDVGSNFEDAFNGMFDSKQQGYDFNATTSTSTTVSSKPMIYPPPHHHNLHINDSMTRDFLGPRGFSHADVFTINAGLAHTLNNSQQPPLTQNPNWQP